MFLSAIPPIVLGIATLIATRLVYGNRRVAANDMLVLVLTVAAWTMIFLGVGVFVTPIGLLIVLLIFGMAVAKFREGQRRALLWTLAIAAERGLPLAPSARAFATRRSDEIGRRAWLLADLLDAGTPLPTALSMSKNPLPVDGELMVRLGVDQNALVVALRESAERGGESEEEWRPIFDQTMYLLFVGLVAVSITSFIMVKIMPTFKAIFDDFGTQLPIATEAAIGASNWLAQHWYLFSPILFYFVFVALVSGFYYATGRIWLPWPFEWLFGRTDNPTVLRGLAVCVGQQLPIDVALQRIGHAYPRPSVSRRLLQAAGDTKTGKDWVQSLLDHRFVTRAEAAVLNSAARAGNLEWALQEMAEVGLRRLIYRARTLLNILAPISLLLIALPVAWLVIGCFIPIVSLIQNLT